MTMSEEEFRRELSKIRDELRECNKDIGKPEVANIVNSRAVRDADPAQWPDITNLVLVILNELRMPRYAQLNKISNIGDIPACMMELYGSRALTELKGMTPEHAPMEDIDIIACAVPAVGRWWYIPGGEAELSEYCVMERRCPYAPTEKECRLKSIKASPASPKDVGGILEAKCMEAYNISEEKYNRIDRMINKATEYTRGRIEESQEQREAKRIHRGFTI